MLRFLAGVGSALLLAAAGFFFWTGVARDEDDPVPAPPVSSAGPIVAGQPARPPAADPRTKEQRRFARADRDKDGRITLEELSFPRRKAYDRLDRDHDDRLSFEEWTVRTREKFAAADANRDRALGPAEFAATAPRRRTATRPDCRC